MSPLVKEAKYHLAQLASAIDRLSQTVEFADRIAAIGITYKAGHQIGKVGAVRNGTRARTNGRKASADGVLAALKGKKLSVGELAETVGASKVSVAYYLQKLRDEKKVKMRGTRRTARWELVG